jgi:predicted CXXCH cytochrome family protein
LEGRAVAATIADHVEPHGGDWQQFLTGKLQSLCAACHESKKKLHERRQVLDNDGWPVEAVGPSSMRVSLPAIKLISRLPTAQGIAIPMLLDRKHELPRACA